MGLLSVCQSVILSVSVTVSLSVFPSTYQTVCLGVCQSVSCSDVMPGVLRRTLSLVGGSLVHCVGGGECWGRFLAIWGAEKDFIFSG